LIIKPQLNAFIVTLTMQIVLRVLLVGATTAGPCSTCRIRLPR
jgi:ribose/xylose/arabinose/galactoside ABC-type transport system permease subunit